MKTKDRYKQNKSASVGEFLTCPSCNSGFEKTHYAQAFCKSNAGTKCKDKYWNTVTPNKRNNTTRISPASAAWLANQTPRVKQSQQQRPQAWEIWGTWHDDDWNEGSGGSGCID